MEPPFTVARQALGKGACRLCVRGDVDIGAVGELRWALTDAITDPRIRIVVLDLRQVAFMGAAGVGALVTARELAEQQGCLLHVQQCSPSVSWVLELCGVAADLGVPSAL